MNSAALKRLLEIQRLRESIRLYLRCLQGRSRRRGGFWAGAGGDPVKQFDRFIATFDPQRTDDLKPGARAFIGQRCEWEAVWLIEDDDGGPYVGQMACTPVLSRASFVWAPECDLSDIEPREEHQ